MTRVSRDVGHTVSMALTILRKIYELEEQGIAPATTFLANELGKHISVFKRYRDALERLGLIEVVPEGNRNLVRLTERGRCVAKCLLG
ncbi:MAG: hypothetical protein F7C35_08240 [Desulfurococcales archaeon]|nr:hypothetical protein [Desulfurococcales archaeon]